jgi:hypothetical protein
MGLDTVNETPTPQDFARVCGSPIELSFAFALGVILCLEDGAAPQFKRGRYRIDFAFFREVEGRRPYSLSATDTAFMSGRHSKHCATVSATGPANRPSVRASRAGARAYTATPDFVARHITSTTKTTCRTAH